MTEFKKRAVVAAVALLGFAVIAFYVINSLETGEPLACDTAIRNFILNLRQDALNPIVIGITYLGNSNTIIAICVLLLVFKKTRLTYGVPLSLTATFSASLQTVIKGLIERPRPPVENFLISQGGFSFPSGHSCTGLVFYGLLAYLILYTYVDKPVHKLLAGLSIALLISIGISRIYVGVHYPTDVLGGWALGLVILMAAITSIEKIRANRSRVGETINKELEKM